jgi:hypothetical protein
MHPIILEELAKIRQLELLKEAESWHIASLVMGEKSDKKGTVQRIVYDVFQRRINIPLFRDLNFKHFDRLSPRNQ